MKSDAICAVAYEMVKSSARAGVSGRATGKERRCESRSGGPFSRRAPQRLPRTWHSAERIADQTCDLPGVGVFGKREATSPLERVSFLADTSAAGGRFRCRRFSRPFLSDE